MVRAGAVLRERNYVVPEDVQSVFFDVCAHRLILRPQAQVDGITARDILAEILQQHPQVKNVVLCFDRDEPGLRFADTVVRRLAERGFNVEKRLPAVGKDYNESLIWYKPKIEKQRGERV